MSVPPRLLRGSGEFFVNYECSLTKWFDKSKDDLYGFCSYLHRHHRLSSHNSFSMDFNPCENPAVSRQETFAQKPLMAKRHLLYGWSDIVMARNRLVRNPSSVVPSGLFAAPCPSRSSMRSHPLPSRGGVLALQASFGRARGGVGNGCNILSAKKFQRRRDSKEVSAKKGQRRRDSEEGTANMRQRRRDSEYEAAKKRQRRSYRPHPCPSP